MVMHIRYPLIPDKPLVIVGVTAPRNYFFAVLFRGARKQLGILRAGRHQYDEISRILYDQDLGFFANESECTFDVQIFGLRTMRSVI